MTVHLYLSLIPEALIASMLAPEEFGSYLAVGSRRKEHGQAIFAEIDPGFRHDYFALEAGIKRCVPHADGSPKHSVYIATYRALEHVPLDTIVKLYLVTAYGEVLALDAQETAVAAEGGLHLYQEIAPVRPLVVSALTPEGYYQFLTQDKNSLVHLPAVCFVELQLGQLASDPEFGAVRDLPYSHINHLRECLLDVRAKPVHNKIVNRVESPEFPYRMIEGGLYLGNTDHLIYFPMPSRDELRDTYYRWWRSANLTPL